MIPLVTATEMQRLDRITIDELGLPALVLMETAGRAVADLAEEVAAEDGAPVLALAGAGNNGGDAVVAARHLANRGFDVRIALCADRAKASPELGHQLAIAEKLGLELIMVDDAADVEALLEEAALVIDGLFGTGLTRPIEGFLAEVIEAVNRAGVAVVSIDLPSGVHADTGAALGTAIHAGHTLALGALKLGHLLHPGRALAGETRLVDIGIPYALFERFAPRAWLVDETVLEEVFAPRAPDGHKGTYGHLLVVAGTPERPGSALLAARAALRTGAGLVTLGSDRETIRRLAPALNELMGADLGEGQPDAGLVLAALERKSALVIGMSLDGQGASRASIRQVLEHAPVPVVADAGALDALGPDPGWLQDRTHPTVLTPHPGEMARLCGLDTRAVQADRPAAARALAAKTGAVVVLKGASTVIAEPDGTLSIVAAGNPGMATGGTGDVLSGVIGALLAQGHPAALAARAGVLLHGRAGDLARARHGEAQLVASDLIDALAQAAVVSGEDEG